MADFLGDINYWLVRSPCKNLKSYDNPFWGKSKEGPNNNTKKKKM